MDRVAVPQLRNHSLEVVQLSAHGMDQNQRRANACGVVAEPRTIGPGEEADLAMAVAPRPRVRRIWTIVALRPHLGRAHATLAASLPKRTGPTPTGQVEATAQPDNKLNTAWAPDGQHASVFVMSPHGPGLPVSQWD